MKALSRAVAGIRSRADRPLTAVTPRGHVALVDLGNVCPNRDEQEHVDALLMVAGIVRDICAPAVGTLGQTVSEVECRFYGGFRDIDGHPTERRAWLTRHIGVIHGLTDRVRILPTIVESIVAAQGDILVGTYANQRQTMVDCMIAEDLGAFARAHEHQTIVLITDDDDFVPAVLAALRTQRAPVAWVRKRPVSRNDSLIHGARLLTDRRWA